jgi:hypothetical protein
LTTSSTRVTKCACCLALVLGALAFVAAPKTALAQNNEAIAESLFIEGKQLYSEKKYAEACQKLAQSHKADPAGGTVLLLAMCYEQTGRTATAWAKYGEAVAMARRDGRPDRAQKAQQGMDALTPKLSYATVTLEPEAKTQPNMELSLDEVAIPLLIDAKVPVDPGMHRLVVSAKGFASWSHEFEITDGGAVVTITVPALRPLAVEPATLEPARPTLFIEPATPVNPPPELEPRSSNSTRMFGWVIGGAGLVSAGIGGYFALHANRLDKKANDRCPSVDCNDAQAVSWNQDALRDAKASTWLVGLGAAAAVTGAALVIFGGSSGERVSTTAIALPNGGVLSISGKY